MLEICGNRGVCHGAWIWEIRVFLIFLMFSLYCFEFYWEVSSDWQLGFLFLVGGLGARITEGNARFGLLAVMKSLIAGIAIMKQRFVFIFASTF